jgi:flagellar protein FlhE
VPGLLLAALLGWAGATAAAPDRAWTQDRTSQGLQAVGRAVAVIFEPGRDYAPIPAGARITRVYASRQYDSRAQVATDLCWGSALGPCVRMQGSHVNTRIFEGRPAQGPLLLVHRVLHWGGDTPPLFIRGTVTVWYTAARP